MKRVALLTFILLSATCLAPVAAAQQSAVARVHIPFTFNAHNQTLDAGTYDLSRIGAHTIRFQNVKTERGVTLLSPQEVVTRDSVNLVFRVYGKNYFMSEVNAPTFRIALPTTREEREMARTIKSRTIEIAAK